MAQRYPCGGVNRRHFLAGAASTPLAAAGLGGRIVSAQEKGAIAAGERLGVPGPYPGRVVEVRHPGMIRDGVKDAAAVRAGLDRGLAALTGAVVSSGGASTWIGTPDGRLWRSDDGHPGLGVSGSGDVKAGILLGLCARGAEPVQAAVWAAYLHGTIGGRLASRYGPTGYLASELAAEVPQALLEIGS